MNTPKLMKIEIAEGLNVDVITSENHEFLLSTQDVANGYGVSSGNIRKHKNCNTDEFFEGEHFITIKNSDTNSNARCKTTPYIDSLKSTKVFWTKAGIIRLGFFIKSDRAKMFRNWAEKLILQTLSKPKEVPQLPNYLQKYSFSDFSRDFEVIMLRELINIDNKKAQKKMADLVTHFVKWSNAKYYSRGISSHLTPQI